MTAPQAPPGSGDSEARPLDAGKTNWVDDVPQAFRPYLRLMRLDRPVGAWLLYWPCVFGLTLGAASDGQSMPNPWYLLLTAIGAIVMRGAGCTYNDIVDRDYDAKVARTRGRPLPSGAVSLRQAWLFTTGLCLTGLVILLTLDLLSAIVLGMSSLILVAIYPFMKRITWWPQIWLGFTFNWGVLSRSGAETGHLTVGAYLFYTGCIFWTLGYDTIYAMQDKEDDILIGVKSSAIRLGPRTVPFLYFCYTVALTLMLAGGWALGLRSTLFAAMLVPGSHFLWQLRTLDEKKPLLCLKLFKANRDTGALIAAALLLATMVEF